jgi:clan AA aspartic protease (TIGR02281 family)
MLIIGTSFFANFAALPRYGSEPIALSTRMISAALRKTSFIPLLLGVAIALVAKADSDPTIEQIYAAAENGRLNQAQQMITRVLADHPRSAKAHFVQSWLYAKEGKIPLARSELELAEGLNPGLTLFSARSVQDLKSHLGLASSPSRPPIASASPNSADAHSTSSRVLLAKHGGTLVAPVLINNAIKLDFTVDSGASDVSISTDVFSALVRAGTITKSDMRGSHNYINAEGESHSQEAFTIRSLKVGNVEVSNVEGSVAPSRSPLLLGQSFLKRFRSWSIDNTTQELVLQP